MTPHQITFQRLPNDGTHRAMCSCGWSITGDREEVQQRAATHDMDEAEETRANKRKAMRLMGWGDETQREKPKRPAFVSGAYRGGK